jgi:hypothetical protein
MSKDPEQRSNTSKEVMITAATVTIDQAKRASFSTVLTIISAVFSLAALIISFASFRLSSEQNDSSQQLALLSLVSDIVQQSALPQRSLADGQAANLIIKRLPSSEVSSVERYRVGEALEDGDDFRPALDLLVDAAKEASDPLTTANSWREAARVSYELQLNKQAESYITLARKAISIKNSTNIATWNNLAYTDFFDIVTRPSAGAPGKSDICDADKGDWSQAMNLISQSPAITDRALNGEEASARKAKKIACRVSVTP